MISQCWTVELKKKIISQLPITRNIITHSYNEFIWIISIFGVLYWRYPINARGLNLGDRKSEKGGKGRSDFIILASCYFFVVVKKRIAYVILISIVRWKLCVFEPFHLKYLTHIHLYIVLSTVCPVHIRRAHRLHTSMWMCLFLHG